jgi:hypothetical protein
MLSKMIIFWKIELLFLYLPMTLPQEFIDKELFSAALEYAAEYLGRDHGIIDILKNANLKYFTSFLRIDLYINAECSYSVYKQYSHAICYYLAKYTNTINLLNYLHPIQYNIARMLNKQCRIFLYMGPVTVGERRARFLLYAHVRIVARARQRVREQRRITRMNARLIFRSVLPREIVDIILRYM